MSKKPTKLIPELHTKLIAIKLSPNTRVQNARDYLNKLEPVQTHFEFKKYNSFVSSKPLCGFEVDLTDMGTTVKPMRYGLVAVDGFTKVARIIPIKNKQVNEIIRGLEYIFAIMGKPQQIYNDVEGAMDSYKLLTVDLNTYEHQHMHMLPRGLFKHFA